MGETDISISPIKDFPVSNPIEILSKDGLLLLRQFTLHDATDIFTLIDRNRPHLSQFGDETAKNIRLLSRLKKALNIPKTQKGYVSLCGTQKANLLEVLI
jgi:hypothetical protein